MDKKLQDLLDLFKESLEDFILSKKERRTLNEEFEKMLPSRQEKHILRAKLFDLAREQIGLVDGNPVLDWLEESMKLLIEERESGESANDVFFSPGETCRDAIIKTIRDARKSLRICVFTISDDDISREIVAAKRRGVHVRIITDDEKRFDHGSDIRWLREKGISVEMDKSPSHMHHKFMTADGKVALTGSYNWTRSAMTQNQENVLVTGDSGTVRKYDKEFERLWEQFA